MKRVLAVLITTLTIWLTTWPATASTDTPTTPQNHSSNHTQTINTNGTTTWAHQPTLWGNTTPNPHTPHRYPGQNHKPETGPHYNHHRYYDPNNAQYITPDPLGLTPSPNPHTYPPNPTNQTGPHGLATHKRHDQENGAANTGADRPTVNWGQQSKHLPGHPNFIPSRSTLTANPEELIQRAGTGTPVGSVPRGQAGFKERIDFGNNIGTYVSRDSASSPTSIGILHYRADGSVHIVPGRPR